MKPDPRVVRLHVLADTRPVARGFVTCGWRIESRGGRWPWGIHRDGRVRWFATLGTLTRLVDLLHTSSRSRGWSRPQPRPAWLTRWVHS